MPDDTNMGEIDMTDAHSAFNDFFKKDDKGNVAVGKGESKDLNKVINKVKQEETPPDRLVPRPRTWRLY